MSEFPARRMLNCTLSGKVAVLSERATRLSFSIVNFLVLIQSLPVSFSHSMEPSNYETLFQQCRFNFLLTSLAHDISEIEKTNEIPRALYAWKVHALFELHLVEDARDATEILWNKIKPKADCGQLLLEAKLNYYLDHHLKAKEQYQNALNLAETPRDRFLALVGLANAHCSDKEVIKAEALFSDIQTLSKGLSANEEILTQLLFGNHALVSNQLEQSEIHFLKSLGLSVREGHTYYLLRSLYAMAKHAKQSGNGERLKTILTMLSSSLDSSESVYLSYLVNHEFKDSHIAVRVPIAIDRENKSIRVWNRELFLHNKPTIFSLVNFLFDRNTWTTKEEISNALWPGEEYNPLIHDNRISDIVRRTRTLLERYAEQPLILLSGRSGIRLSRA